MWGRRTLRPVVFSLVDLRWQMVLDCLGAVTPPFSQGALQMFRERMVAHEMDGTLLEKTVTLVRSGSLTEGEGCSMSKALRAAIDSRPFAGPGGLRTRSTFSATRRRSFDLTDG